MSAPNLRVCRVCVGGGFWARACPGCGEQRPLNIAHTKVYQALGYDVRVGDRVQLRPEVSEADLAALIRELGLGVSPPWWRRG